MVVVVGVVCVGSYVGFKCKLMGSCVLWSVV